MIKFIFHYILYFLISQMDVPNKKPSGCQIKWTENMDALLIEALLHQQLIGNRINGQWTFSSYDTMVKELREKLDLPIKKEHLQNRQKTLKKIFNDAYDMFKNSSGFGWDEESKRFVAEPEVWKALIEAKPEAKKWTTTPLPFYEKLLDLSAKDRANGKASLTAKERARQRSSNEPITIDEIDVMVTQNEATLQGFDPNSPSAAKSTSPTTPKSESSSKGKKRKEISEEDYEIKILKQGLDSVADAIREGNSILKQICPRVYSSDEIYEEIVSIGVEESKQFKAYRYLNANDTRVKEFFGCPKNFRKAFLIQMMEEDGVFI
ncbi:uncharacterized protein LOC104883794 isoform X1 [Beta vulgaris subsp. vulgaris]|uniref:uncharacterized protein LOC104883794 isoform X1 n=2 Tax=Beta vulgaris subsp. vulgaris TaxID=3555 RepID=UPI0020372730|nr:uncharacterized protein LOC104883794 isoform X1 [Beta vulgaris subsp. vulgaris]